MQTASDRENTQVESLGKGLQILRMFTLERPEISALEASKHLGCSQSTAYRLLQTLTQQRFLKQDPVTKRYTLSYHVVSLSSVVLDSSVVRRAAIPEMEELARLAGARVNLAVLDEDAVVWIARIEGGGVPQVNFQLGRRAPLHATGLGKILLAHLPADELRATLQRIDLTAWTSRTITSVADLHRELEEVRAQGYAIDRGEWHDEIRGLAAPIRSQSRRVVAALSVSGNVPGVTLEMLLDLKQEILRRASRVSNNLGY